MTAAPDTFVYLDHAATAWPRRPGVDDAMRQAIAAPLGNPARSSHTIAEDAASIIERARGALARFIGTPDPRRVCITPSCTIACHLAIAGTLRAWRLVLRDRSGSDTALAPRVIASALEHNAVARPLAEAAALGEIELIVINPDPHGFINPADFLTACDDRTALLCLTHASNVLGTIQPVRALADALRAHRGANNTAWPLLFTDAAQTAGLIAEPLAETGADLIAFGAHKSIGGPTGIGALIVQPDAWRDPADAGTLGQTRLIEPTIHGGTGGDPLHSDGSPRVATPRTLPQAFEPGTPNIIAAGGLLAALQHREQQSRDTPHASHDHAVKLITHASEALRAIPGIRLYPDTTDHAWRDSCQARQRVGVLAFNAEGYSPHGLTGILDASFNIATRPGLHCAPWCHQHLGTHTTGALRISVGDATSDADIDAFFAAMQSILKH